MKKSKSMAIASFVFGLLSILPLINYLLMPLSIYLGFRSLQNIKKNPEAYGGKIFAVTGLTISILILIFTLTGIGICLAGYKEICKGMGFNF